MKIGMFIIALIEIVSFSAIARDDMNECGSVDYSGRACQFFLGRGDARNQRSDSDCDGLTDNEEDANYNCRIDPGETNWDNPDTDQDCILDGIEVAIRTNPTNPDTDGDGLFDGEEINAYHTNPLNPDTDGDTYRDGDEVRAGYNPNGPGLLLNLPEN